MISDAKKIPHPNTAGKGIIIPRKGLMEIKKIIFTVSFSGNCLTRLSTFAQRHDEYKINQRQ